MLVKDNLKPETIKWLEEYKKNLKNHKLKQPKSWYKNVKDVVKNISTTTSTKENV